MATAEAAARFGVPLTLPGFDTVQTLRPIEKDVSPPNTYSGNYGTDEFPLHTDMAHWAVPPRYLLLRCVIGAASVATRLLDGRQLVATIGELALMRALVRPRRPLENRRTLLRLLDWRDGSDRFIRWDYLFIAPATKASAATFTAVSSYAQQATPHEIVLRAPGDTLVIDNWRMLHGRAKVGDGASARRIDRVYIDKLH